MINLTKTTTGKTIRKWNWKKDFYELMKAKVGILKLQGDKPTTAPIGNWGILSAIHQISEQFGYGSYIQGRLFMGKKKTKSTKLDIALSLKDNEETIQQQWQALKNAFEDPKQVLLFHLTNHYALVFAIRDWLDLDENGNVIQHRQILTARKGQRPTAWIDFTEIRDILLGWEGYKMMCVQSTLSMVELRSQVQSKFHK
jgi:hypothetical protein